MIHKSQAADLGTPSPAGDKMEFPEDRIQEEANWAYYHAEYWAANYGDMNPAQVKDFCEWYRDGWLAYLEIHSDRLDGSFLMLRRQWQDQAAHENEAHDLNIEMETTNG